MGKRRPSGDGMVRKREDGRWEGRIVVGHKKNGDSIFRYLSAGTQKELMKQLHHSIEEYRGVDLSEDSKMPLGQWLDRWLEEYIAPTVRETTLRGYQKLIDSYLKPRLGEKPVCKISPDDVQRLYRELLQNGRVREHPQYGCGLSGCTVRKHLTARNPTSGATLPRKKATPKQILNDEQLDRFLEEIKKDEIWYDFFYTELTTGLRRGEICGLRWTDFQMGKGTLAIRRTVHQKPGGGLSVGEPKTGQGSRVITLPPSTTQLLAERKRRSVSQWIFHDPLRPEQPVHPGSAYRRMKELLAQAELPSIRFHDLRHTFATHALASGVDAKTLSGILGHTKASFTLDTYTHVTGDMQRHAAEIVGDFITEMLGDDLKPWESGESGARAVSI